MSDKLEAQLKLLFNQFGESTSRITSVVARTNDERANILYQLLIISDAERLSNQLGRISLESVSDVELKEAISSWIASAQGLLKRRRTLAKRLLNLENEGGG